MGKLSIHELYESKLDWIYSFTNLENKREKKDFSENRKLRKIEALLKYLDNPHENQPIIHIAGTKGKGSVAFILNRLFQNSGYKTGLYTSPHIFDVTERVQINSSPIPIDRFINYCDILKKYTDNINDPELTPTFFDLFTAIGFLYFKENNCDVWIVETGLGGRLDSTNIVNPILTIITSISKDHTNILGNSYLKIAREKAGIIKQGKTIILGKNRNSVVNEILNIARSKNSPYYYVPEQFTVKSHGYEIEDDGIPPVISGKEEKVNKLNYEEKKTIHNLMVNHKNIKTSLLGDYQLQNIATALCAKEVLEEKFSFKNDSEFLNNIKWRGRCDLFQTIFNDKNINILIDGAHNYDSAKVFSKTVNHLTKENILSSGDTLVIIGILKNKDYKGILKELIFLGNTVFFVEPDRYKECAIDNYETIYLKLKPEMQNFIKIKSDFTNVSPSIIKGKENYLMNPEKSDLIFEILKLYYEKYHKTPDNLILSGSLYLASLGLKSILDRQNQDY